MFYYVLFCSPIIVFGEGQGVFKHYNVNNYYYDYAIIIFINWHFHGINYLAHHSLLVNCRISWTALCFWLEDMQSPGE